MIIGINGYAGCGKDTVANILFELLPSHTNREVKIVHFAEMVK